jgi:hypothetical protein
MQNKKIAALALIIAIALSAFGFAYAHWSDMVTMEGTVEMGSVTIAWDENELLDYTDNEPLLPEPKDVGSADIYYDPDSYIVDPHTGKGGYKILIVEIHNAYPQYTIAINTLNINNTGTVPVHFVDLIIAGYDVTDDEELMFVWEPGFEHEVGAFWDNGANDVWDDPLGSVDDVEIINVEVVNFVSTQLEPCHNTKGEIDLDFKQEAEQCHTYTFTVEIVGIQWNKIDEYVPP